MSSILLWDWCTRPLLGATPGFPAPTWDVRDWRPDSIIRRVRLFRTKRLRSGATLGLPDVSNVDTSTHLPGGKDFHPQKYTLQLLIRFKIVAYIQSQPRGFASLIELDLFVDVYSVTPGIDSNPDAPRNRICRLCATEVLLWGLRDWWIRERRKSFLNDNVLSRKDCPEGRACGRQKDLGESPYSRFDGRPRVDRVPCLVKTGPS